MSEHPFVDLDAAIEFRATLNSETDRGCALMAAAYLDDRLVDLLKSHFVDDDNRADELLGQSKPLGTFFSRIDLAYLPGLVSPDEHRALCQFRLKIPRCTGRKFPNP
jgi:hypothetical protein